MWDRWYNCPSLINRSFTSFYFLVSLNNQREWFFLYPSDLTGVMDRLRHLGTRRSSDQKMHQTTSVIISHLLVNHVFSSFYFRRLQLIIRQEDHPIHHQMETMNNKNHELKFPVSFSNSEGIVRKKCQRTLFPLVRIWFLSMNWWLIWINFSAEQATIDQQHHLQQQTQAPRVPSSPQPQLSPQIRNYVKSSKLNCLQFWTWIFLDWTTWDKEQWINT